MRYVMARLEEYLCDITYRYYVTDYMYAEGCNKKMANRFVDIIKGKMKVPDQRSGDEIAEDVLKRAGITLGD